MIVSNNNWLRIVLKGASGCVTANVLLFSASLCLKLRAMIRLLVCKRVKVKLKRVGDNDVM